MDKSAGNKKRSPAGTTRRAYSIFGGIINLAPQQQQSHTPKSNALSSPGNAAAGGGGGTSQDPQGSSTNVYTVTVTNSKNPDNTNQVKTYENLIPVKKQRGDQSTSTVSSLTPSSCGMNSNSSGNSNNGGGGGGGGGGSRIGHAPRTLSILTALNELAISDEIGPNPTCSALTPPASTGNNRSSSNSAINAVSISKSNPTHSSCHYPPKRNASYGGNIHHHHGNKAGTHENPTNTNNFLASSTSSASALHHHHHHHHHHQQYNPPKHTATSSTSTTTSVYHSTSSSSVKGLYANNTSGANSIGSGGGTSTIRLTKGYNEQLGALPPPLPPYGNLSESTASSKFPFTDGPSSSNYGAATSTLPLILRRTGNKSRGSHKESSTRKGAAKQRDRSKSRTPDWIWKIFQLTKHGKLEELQQSLQGLDPTLIRHLADAKGNTVLHCAARGGHVNTLQWLVSVLGSQCTEAVLNDHNQAGRNVILTALKKGQIQCLQWLVHHTKCGEKALVPNEGERSLLHHAATHGSLNVVQWLCSELIDKGISVDIRDAGGMTPLHDAAKSGHITVCHELILAGADPLSQTELGWRPSDLAIRHRHMECASYFMVAEAAGSLGNQLHSLLLAFNHLRQEHEELRLHFRETLRVGKWLAKERNDLIKQFPTKWTQETGSSQGSGSNAAAIISSPPSILLGGTNNGTRFSDLEHKLVVAEQAWKKMSQNVDKTSSGEEILNGEESTLSNVSSHDFLHRRLAAVQLRHERSQSLGNSVLSSGSSDEDPYEDENSSSSDASSSDMDVERITSVTAGSGGSAGMMVGQNSPAIIHSSTVSPLQKNSSCGSTMRTRPASGKAAPWLLPPNDAFLSQLSPFVGAHVGKSLPTLDLLHGAPTPPALLSPIVTPSSPSAASSLHQPATSGMGTSSAAAVTPAITTDTAGKNEKSLVQMDTERHGSNHAGKRDSTSLEISVLEVIEPTSHASPASSSFKKGFHQAPDLICGTQYRTRHSDKQRMPQQKKQFPQQSLSLRDNHERKHSYYSHSEDNLVDHHLEADGLYEPISPYLQDDDCLTQQQQHYNERKLGTSHYHLDNRPRKLSNTSFKQSVDTLDTMTTCKGESSSRQDSKSSFSANDTFSHPSRNKGGNEQLLSRPSSSLSISLSALKKKTGGDNDQQQSRIMAHASHERTCDNEICCSEARSNVNFASSPSAVGELHSVTVAQTANSSFDISRDNPNSGSSSTTRNNIISKSRTSSPKSYVTKLTVIPVEAATETCFLSVRSTSFAQEEDQQQRHHGEQEQAATATAAAMVEADQDHHHHGQEGEEEEESHQLHLPGDNPDELSSLAFSCQIPSYSVSSSNTPVMPRFNSSGTVVFPSRKPSSSSDWHSTELLSLTTPDSSLAGRLSPTPSETSRTESALAPPPSYVSHASQNSEVSKTESARGHHHQHHHYHHTMNEVSGEERDLESPVGGDGVLHLQSSYINHPANSRNSRSSPFQSIHPHTLTIATSSSTATADSTSQQLNYSQNTNNSNSSNNNATAGSSMDSATHTQMVLVAEERNSLVASFEMCKSDRKKNKDYSSAPTNKRDQGDDDDDASSAVPTSSTAGTHDVDEDDDHDGDNDRSTVKQRGLFEKQQNKRIPAASASTSITRFIRSHLSTTNIHKASAQQQRLPKGHHHHQRGQSKPWYEIEGSDDEGSLLRVAKSKSSHSSNFSISINSNNNSGSSSNIASSSSSSTAATSNPEESSSQNESAAEENENNNSGSAGGGVATNCSGGGTEAERKDQEEGV